MCLFATALRDFPPLCLAAVSVVLVLYIWWIKFGEHSDTCTFTKGIVYFDWVYNWLVHLDTSPTEDG